jgi:hypothetical protein
MEKSLAKENLKFDFIFYYIIDYIFYKNNLIEYIKIKF